MNFTIFDTPVIKTLFRIISLITLKFSGWKIAGDKPHLPKYVMIAAPHTSNWDFVYTILMAFALNMKIYWMGKDTLFKGPAGIIMRWLGGISIDRSKANNIVGNSVDAFNSSEKLTLVVPPEGTRSKARYWKTGFYHIAHGANVPIVLGFLDFRLKKGGFGPALIPTGNIEEDMEIIKAFYKNVSGKYPDLTSDVSVISKDMKPLDYTHIISGAHSILTPSGNIESDTEMLQFYYGEMTNQFSVENNRVVYH